MTVLRAIVLRVESTGSDFSPFFFSLCFWRRAKEEPASRLDFAVYNKVTNLFLVRYRECSVVWVTQFSPKGQSVKECHFDIVSTRGRGGEDRYSKGLSQMLLVSGADLDHFVNSYESNQIHFNFSGTSSFDELMMRENSYSWSRIPRSRQ